MSTETADPGTFESLWRLWRERRGKRPCGEVETVGALNDPSQYDGSTSWLAFRHPDTVPDAVARIRARLDAGDRDGAVAFVHECMTIAQWTAADSANTHRAEVRLALAEKYDAAADAFGEAVTLLGVLVEASSDEERDR